MLRCAGGVGAGADAAEGSAERLSYEENEAWKRDQCVTDDEVQTITQPTDHDTLSRFENLFDDLRSL